MKKNKWNYLWLAWTKKGEKRVFLLNRSYLSRDLYSDSILICNKIKDKNHNCIVGILENEKNENKDNFDENVTQKDRLYLIWSWKYISCLAGPFWDEKLYKGERILLMVTDYRRTIVKNVQDPTSSYMASLRKSFIWINETISKK